MAALAAALGMAGTAVQHASAAGKSKKLRPPTLLWKTYPLVQRSSTPAVRTTAAERREAAAPTPGDSGRLDNMLLLTALLATALAAGSLVFMRRPSAVRDGGAVRGRGGARSRGPTRRPEPRRPRPRRIAQRPPADAAADAEPDVRQEDEPAPKPKPVSSELDRVLDDLLAALQPHQAREQAPARIPELELRELIVQKYEAPASARRLIEREIDAALERIEARRAAEARAREAQRTTLARSEIRLWRGMVKSRLYAVMAGSEDAFAVSSPFRLRDAAVPGPEAQRALSSLLAELTRAGWTVVHHGSAWYDRRLSLFAPDPAAGAAGASRVGEDIRPRVVYRSAAKEDRAEDSAG